MKKWILFLIIIFAAVFSRNFLFSRLFSYEIVKERKVYPLENEKFKDDKPAGEVKDIIEKQLKADFILIGI